MKTQHLKSGITLVMALMAIGLFGQTTKEAVQPLTIKAKKGYLEDVKYYENGNLEVLYKIGGDKKKDEIFFEQYTFDNGLKFLDSKAANEPKVESRPDTEETYMSAWVGGNTSFDVLSMKLKVNITKEKQKWNYKKQRYETDEVISDETVKLKAESGRAYFGVDKYWSKESGNLIVLGYYETKDKKNPKQYVLLTIDFEGGVKEKNIDVTGAYSIVFCTEISENAPGKGVGKQDFILILAPKKGTAEATKYVYLHYDIKGALKNKVEFESPSSNLLVNSADVKNGEVFLSALSTKSKDFYEETFTDYAAIQGRGMSDGSENYQMMKYNKAANEEMAFFHLLKFSGNKLMFASTASVDDFKAKKKIAPGEKSGKIYDGKKFAITSFEVTPANEYLIAGQRIFRINIGDLKNPDFRTGYGDVICFHFDAKGVLKAQYAVDKVFEDKKSEIFDMPQNFYVSGDGKYAYWEILEVKGYSGYNSYWDAVSGRKTFRPRYFPRITKIDLQSGTLSEFKYPGQKKYFIYGEGKSFNSNTLTTTYVGRDEDNENLWIGKVTFD